MTAEKISFSAVELTVFVCLLILQSRIPSQGETYDLRAVKDIEAFNGSAAAKELLAKNGFVVADPAFKQIFEAYIKSPQTKEPSEKSPMGQSLPSFITTDSAWDTYHVLLEEGVKQMEEVQAHRLAEFSRLLLNTACDQKAGPKLVQFASVGLALQDEHYRQSLAAADKQIVDGLRTGTAPIEAPVGFELSPLQFRAQSFYTQSPELSDYFAARQWYASVVFRLSSPQETKLAVTLAALVNSKPELLNLWKELSDPYDEFLARAEDGTVREYVEAAKAVLGTKGLGALVSDGQIAKIQEKLEGLLPFPRVSDQLLSQEQYAEFGKQTRGFRLLPPRRLPCAVCFHNTVDPKIPGRMYPSGLDFLAASPVLRSPAAVRAVQSQFGKKVSDLVLKADCGPMPDSLHGEAMQLLATLQKPMPSQAPAAMRTEAWSDLQLWTQLGAWAEQRHTWALHTKLTVEYMGSISPPKGMVAPYPDFFAGLSKLTRRTAGAFEKAELGQQFDVITVAGDLLNDLNLSKGLSHARDEKEFEKASGKLEQLNEFQDRYYEKHRTELEVGDRRGAFTRMQKDLEDLARRCATNGPASEAEAETLRMFFDCRQDICRRIGDFAPVCDRLAELAKKSLNGEALADNDSKWIENYGVTLAGFHFYYGNSYEVPRDDFPIVTRVYSNPLTDSMLYAGLARPQALYVIVPDGKSLQLYRGAVMTYREFVRPNDQLLDDESWRELISKGQTPPAPPFTRSFLAEKSAAEWIESLRDLSFDANYDEFRDILWHLAFQATDKELPELIHLMAGVATSPNSRQIEEIIGEMKDGTPVTNYFEVYANWVPEVTEGLSEIIAGLSWAPNQRELLSCLASTNAFIADASAYVLIRRPANIDQSALIAGLESPAARTRRLYCVLLGSLPQQTEQTRNALLHALRDTNGGVRWQAVLAINSAGWNDTQSQAALLETLNDTNAFVAAAAAYSIGQLRATNLAPVLFAKLQTELESTNKLIEKLEQDSTEIAGDIREEQHTRAKLLDPDNFERRLHVDAKVVANMRRMASMRVRPEMFNISIHGYDLTTALIEALGDLGYIPATDELFKLRGTDYDVEVTRALAKVAPDRLAADLLPLALNKENDSYEREHAMLALSDISATNHVRDLLPLLDDTTPIVYFPPMGRREWRVCDRAAVTMAVMLGWQNRRTLFMEYEQQEELINRVRDWAKQTH